MHVFLEELYKLVKDDIVANEATHDIDLRDQIEWKLKEMAREFFKLYKDMEKSKDESS